MSHRAGRCSLRLIDGTPVGGAIALALARVRLLVADAYRLGRRGEADPGKGAARQLVGDALVDLELALKSVADSARVETGQRYAPLAQAGTTGHPRACPMTARHAPLTAHAARASGLAISAASSAVSSSCSTGCFRRRSRSFISGRPPRRCAATRSSRPAPCGIWPPWRRGAGWNSIARTEAGPVVEPWWEAVAAVLTAIGRTNYLALRARAALEDSSGHVGEIHGCGGLGASGGVAGVPPDAEEAALE